MTVLLALMLPMLCPERAAYNATNTLHANGIYAARVACMQASDGFACAAVAIDGRHYFLRCSGAMRDVCTFKAEKE